MIILKIITISTPIAIGIGAIVAVVQSPNLSIDQIAGSAGVALVTSVLTQLAGQKIFNKEMERRVDGKVDKEPYVEFRANINQEISELKQDNKYRGEKYHDLSTFVTGQVMQLLVSAMETIKTVSANNIAVSELLKEFKESMREMQRNVNRP